MAVEVETDERLGKMRELALILNRKRVKRGSIDFDLPEPLIEFDANGFMVGVTRAPRNIAHRIIEEFMLAANEAEKAADVKVIDYRMVGATGRVYLAGEEANVRAAGDAAVAALEAIQ